MVDRVFLWGGYLKILAVAPQTVIPAVAVMLNIFYWFLGFYLNRQKDPKGGKSTGPFTMQGTNSTETMKGEGESLVQEVEICRFVISLI